MGHGVEAWYWAGQMVLLSQAGLKLRWQNLCADPEHSNNRVVMGGIDNGNIISLITVMASLPMVGSVVVMMVTGLGLKQ